MVGDHLLSNRSAINAFSAFAHRFPIFSFRNLSFFHYFQILIYLPEHLGRKWQYHSVGRLMSKLLHPGNSWKLLKREAMRLFLLWYQVSDRAKLSKYFIHTHFGSPQYERKSFPVVEERSFFDFFFSIPPLCCIAAGNSWERQKTFLIFSPPFLFFSGK